MSETKTTTTPSSLRVVVEDLLAMLYFPNNQRQHENAIAMRILSHGYLEYKLPPKTKLKKSEENHENFLPDMPPGTFIQQPYGTQGNPDFFIKGPEARLIPIEAKSFKYGKPMWNSHVPEPNYYYLLCSKKYNSSTIGLGSDLITDAQRRKIRAIETLVKETVEEHNPELLLLDENNRGFVYYPRIAIQQVGGKKNTDYFTHEDRQRVEARCLASLSS